MPETVTELMLRFVPERDRYEVKVAPEADAVSLTKDEMTMAVQSHVTLEGRKILACLVDQAQKMPGRWHSASSEPLRPGQATL